MSLGFTEDRPQPYIDGNGKKWDFVLSEVDPQTMQAISWQGDKKAMIRETLQMLDEQLDDMEGMKALWMMVDLLNLARAPYQYRFEVVEHAPDYTKNPELCPCVRCKFSSGDQSLDWCYAIARDIDENGNYHDDKGNLRDGQNHEVIA